jgi:hypothetical protein
LSEYTLVHGFRQRIGEFLHLVESPIQIVVGRSLVAPIDGRGGIAARTEDLSLRHEPRFNEIVEHDIGARTRCRQVDVRSELRGCLEQASQHGSFREIHIAC